VPAALSVILVASCARTQTSDKALNQSLAAAGKQRTTVYPLAGKLTIDGAPPQPEPGEFIIVMLNDPGQLDIPVSTRPHVTVSPTGEFAFRTNAADDGVAPGTYVVTFARLTKQEGKFFGPDAFHNLYNDPEKNQTEYPELKIEHRAPGKKDYDFNLKIAGREESAAGPKALTHIP
jgi:hypothetical protein